MARKAISTRTRFSILARDNFTCQYCGAKAPDVELHVDHIKPVAIGGTNAFDNLCAACATCNLGKSASTIGGADRSLGAAAVNDWMLRFNDHISTESAAVIAHAREVTGWQMFSHEIDTALRSAAREYSAEYVCAALDEHYPTDGTLAEQVLAIERIGILTSRTLRRIVEEDMAAEEAENGAA